MEQEFDPSACRCTAPASPSCRDRLLRRRIRRIKVCRNLQTCGAASALKKGIKDGGEALALSAEPQNGRNVALDKRPACVWEVEEDDKQVFLLLADEVLFSASIA